MKIAEALTTATGSAQSATGLPFQTLELSADLANVSFNVAAHRYRCDIRSSACIDIGAAQPERARFGPPAGGRGGALAVTSPDGKREAFVRNWNLWVRDVATKAETPLTVEVSAARRQCRRDDPSGGDRRRHEDHHATQRSAGLPPRDARRRPPIVRVADTRTGDVRTLFAETVPTHYESVTGWRVLWSSNEVLWYSQRDDWGQLYLYDLGTGALKHQVTGGEGPVSQIVRADEKSRVLWYGAMGREKGQDPYWHHYYRIGLDGRNVVSLTPEDGDHNLQLSPDGKWMVDTYSRPDLPPTVVLRDAGGKMVMPLEKADISKLVATGWKPPLSFTVKAADGTTDLYGQLFRPTHFDSTRKYPIINHAYPGPQTGSTGARTFAAARGDRQALAELGFIVVTIDGRGTPGRSKSFHDAYYGAMGRDNTLPDQVAGKKELARRYSWIDIDRAAMWGHSGGGFITADALIKAGKDFDLLMLPNQAHGYGTASNYMMRRRWDYFVRWLEEAEPPKEYQIRAP